MLPQNDVNPITPEIPAVPAPPPHLGAAQASTAPSTPPPLGATAPPAAGLPPAPPAAGLPPAPPAAGLPPTPPAPPATTTQELPTIEREPPQAAATTAPDLSVVQDVPSQNVATVTESQQQVAVAEPATQMVSMNPKDLAAKAAEMGFDGLELDGVGAYPIVTLKDGVFSAKGLGELGQEFYARTGGSREKFVISNGLDNNNAAYDFRYTFDMVTTHNNEEVATVKADWVAQGYTPEEKKYIDLSAFLAGGEFDGVPVILSIPPGSVYLFSNYWRNNFLRGKDIRNGITHVFKGKKVEGKKIKNPWIPWNFEEYVAR